MKQMMIWASMHGWLNITREMVYDKVVASERDRSNIDALTHHMDVVYNALQDEQAAAMAGVIFADSGFVSPEDNDDWS